MLDPAQQRARIEAPYDAVAMMLIVTAFLVGLFYCLDALHGERRDRSILFWKSLPISDLTTVLAKACIPLVVLPLLTFLLVLATHLIMLLWSTALLLLNGLPPATTSQLPLHQSLFVLVYGLITLTLWHAPIYAWLLLLSAWARRAVFLWAALPILAVGAVERIAFQTTHWGTFLKYRFFGGMDAAFAFPRHGTGVPTIDIPQLTPWKFLGSPGLWLGLIFAVVFLAAAVRLRRAHGPL